VRGVVTRIVTFALLFALSLASAAPTRAQQYSIPDPPGQSAKIAKKQQKAFQKAAKNQQKAMKKSAKAQQKADKKAAKQAYKQTPPQTNHSAR
jgi:predicted lipoprotein